MSLRSKLIHLAHENPEVRPHLLPLLREAAQPPAPSWLETQLGNVFTSEAAGHEFWFIPLSVTKSNTAKGLMVAIRWSDSAKPLKAKQTSFSERDLSGRDWKVIPAGTVPDPVKARFQEVGVRVASMDHLAALRQPKSGEPVYEGNAMAIPLAWGTSGVMEPFYAARAMYPLFHAAKNGVAFVLDTRGVFEKIGLPAVAKSLQNYISARYGEDYAMDMEYFQDAPEDVVGDRLDVASQRAQRAEKVRVILTPVTSPTTGKSGLKVVFRPTVEMVEGP